MILQNFPFFYETITFLFVFAVVYGLLGMANILKSKRADALVGLVFGAVTASQTYAVSFFKELLPVGAIILGVLFFFGFIKKLFLESKGTGNGNNKTDYFPLLVVLAVLILLVGVSGNLLKKALAPYIGVENGIVLIILIIIVLLFYAANKIGKGKGNEE